MYDNYNTDHEPQSVEDYKTARENELAATVGAIYRYQQRQNKELKSMLEPALDELTKTCQLVRTVLILLLLTSAFGIFSAFLH